MSDYLFVTPIAHAQDTEIERILGGYGEALWRLTSGYCASRADRQDLYQEIACAVWRAFPMFRGESSERTWIYSIAHKVAVSASLRSNRRREEPLDLGLHLSVRATAESSMLETERRELLMDAIRDLEGIDKQVVLLYLEEFDNADIAQVVGLSEGAVATRLSRLRTRLAETIAGRAGAK